MEAQNREEPTRSPQEIRRLKRLMAKIARLFSGQGRLATVPGEGWACGFRNGDRFERLLLGYLRGDISEAELDQEDLSTFIPTSLTYDESWFGTKPEDVIKGVLRHEVGHARHSDYRLMAKGQRFAIDEGYLPSTYMGSWNAREDPWVNNREMQDSETVRGQMAELYGNSLPTVLAELREGKSSLGRQLGLREMLEWMRNEFGIIDQATLDELDNQFLDPRVVEAFQKTKGPSQRFFDPNNTAEENYRIMCDEIWPIVKELEVEDFQDEVMKQLGQPEPGEGQPSDQGQPDEGEGQGQPGQGQPGEGQPGQGQPGQGQPGQGQPGQGQPGQGQPGEGQPGEGQPGQGQPDQGQPGQGQPGEGQPGQGQPGEGQGQPQPGEHPLISKLPPDLQRKLRKEIERQRSQTPQGIQGQTKEQVDQTQGKPGEPGKEGEFEPKKMPKDLRRDLQKGIEGLPKGDQEGLQKPAKEALDKKQAGEIAKDQPQSMQMEKDEETGQYIQKPKTTDDEEAQKKKKDLEKFEHRDRQEQEGKREEIAKKLKDAENEEEVDQIIRDEDLPEDFENDLRKQAEARKGAIEQARKKKQMQMKSEGFEEHEEDLFDELQELERAVRQEVKRFVRAVAQFLPRKSELEWEEGHKSGRKLVMRKLPIKIPTGHIDIYSRRAEKKGEEPKLFFKLIIDRSASMRGQKMEESLKTAMFFALTLVEFGIPFSITFFDSDTETTMEFGEEFEGRGARVKIKTMRASKKSGNTNIEQVLREADEEILRNKRRYPDCLSALMFIGDGDANEGATGAELRALVDEIKQRHITTAYALGAQGRALIRYFGEDCTAEADEFGSDLLGKAKTKLKQVLRQASKRFKST
jgi:hypothetical protein